MTVTVDALDGSDESALAGVLPREVLMTRPRIGEVLASTRWQSRFVLVTEFGAFTAAVFGVSSLLGTALFPLAFVASYALATAFTFRWRSRLNLSVLDDLPLLVVSLAAAGGIGYWSTAFINHWGSTPGPSAPRPSEVGTVVFAALAALVIAKVVAYVAVRRVRSLASLEGEHAVVLGTGRDADFLTDRLQTHREFGLKLLGQIPLTEVDDTESGPRRPMVDQALGRYPTARTILVAQSGVSDIEIMPSLRAAVARGCNVFYVPRFAELGQYRLNAEAIWGLPLHSVTAPGGGCQRVLKRGLDIVVAGLASLLLGPMMLMVGLIVRRETGGSMLFRQRRIGRGGREFNLLKFQTLVPRDAIEGDTGWNIAQDDRLGPFGRFLRATSIDELPQLWNVLRGDMSLVGPRPERPHYVELFSEQYSHYAERHRVPVGLTGWAQIHRLRGDTSIDDRARFDNAYCDQWSVWSDLKIILKTVPEVFRHSGG